MNKLYIAMYHYTRNLAKSRYPEIKGLDVELFRKQVEFFKEKMRPVTMEQVIEAFEGKGELPENAVLLTFDDGYVDNYTFALPVLEEANIQGSFFISGKTFAEHKLLDVNKIHYILASSDINKLIVDVKERMEFYRGSEFDYPPTEELFEQYAVANRFDCKEIIFVKRILQTVLPERLRNIITSDLFEKYMNVTEEQLAHELYLTEDQIKTMKRHGMFIGVHGYDHYWLANLPKDQMEQDIRKGMEVLGDYIDMKKWVMNYPYGNYNDEVVDFVKGQGACLGLTTEVGAVQLDRDNPLTLPRFDCNDFPPKSNVYLER